MKARPILFSGPMVRALLDGRKTQTRRTIKPEPASVKALGPGGALVPFKRVVPPPELPTTICEVPVRCPYGEPGDLLWVKETYRLDVAYNDQKPTACPTNAAVFYEAGGSVGAGVRGKTRVSIHMPRWASRLTLEIWKVRVERLQSISPEDARDEGVDRRSSKVRQMWLFGADQARRDAIYLRACPWEFEDLWRSINGPDSWEANPWVWVVEFAVHQTNVDTIIHTRAA